MSHQSSDASVHDALLDDISDVNEAEERRKRDSEDKRKSKSSPGSVFNVNFMHPLKKASEVKSQDIKTQH